MKVTVDIPSNLFYESSDSSVKYKTIFVIAKWHWQLSLCNVTNWLISLCKVTAVKLTYCVTKMTAVKSSNSHRKLTLWHWGFLSKCQFGIIDSCQIQNDTLHCKLAAFKSLNWVFVTILDLTGLKYKTPNVIPKWQLSNRQLLFLWLKVTVGICQSMHGWRERKSHNRFQIKITNLRLVALKVTVSQVACDRDKIYRSIQ